jgi:hypothetical protein
VTAWRQADTVYPRVTGRKGGPLTLRRVGTSESPVRNSVVLTGDVHSHWAAEVRTGATFVVPDRAPALHAM